MAPPIAIQGNEQVMYIHSSIIYTKNHRNYHYLTYENKAVVYKMNFVEDLDVLLDTVKKVLCLLS